MKPKSFLQNQTHLYIAIIGITALIYQAQGACNFASVDKILQDSIKSIGNSGLLVGNVNSEIYKKAFGTYTTETVVPIASGTKFISTTLIMKLVDEGKIDLDSSVGFYLPKFKDIPLKIGVQKYNPTVRQLISHTAGFPGNNMVLNNTAITLQAAADSIAEDKLQYVPGTDFVYGGVSFQVAGAIAEKVTGKSWNDLVTEKIYVPLGMTKTTYGNTKNPRIAGGASSCLADYGALLKMHLNKGVYKNVRILSEASVREMYKDQTNGKWEKAGTPYEGVDAYTGSGYGFGLWLEKLDNNNNATEMSDQGAFGFSPWISLEHNVYGVLLVQSAIGKVLPTYFTLKDSLYAAIGRCSETISQRPESVRTVSKKSTSYSAGSIISKQLRAGVVLNVIDVSGKCCATVICSEGRADISRSVKASGVYHVVLPNGNTVTVVNR